MVIKTFHPGCRENNPVRDLSAETYRYVLEIWSVPDVFTATGYCIQMGGTVSHG